MVKFYQNLVYEFDLMIQGLCLVLLDINGEENQRHRHNKANDHLPKEFSFLSIFLYHKHKCSHNLILSWVIVGDCLIGCRLRDWLKFTSH